MSINIASNFELFAALPLDARTQVANIAARNAITAGQRYEGLWCYVVDSDGGGTPATYQLQNGITNSDWILINSGTAITGIGSAECVAVWGSATNLTANINFTRSNATGIVNNEQGLDVGVNTTTTRYVSPTGSDLADGLTALTPWQTRQHAFNEMAAFLPGTYEIVSAVGTYNEILDSPYSSMGRALDSSGTIVNNTGDETTPANIVAAGSGDLYTNAIFGRGYSGAMRFAGFRFVGDATGSAFVNETGGTIFLRNCEFAQVQYCADANLNSKIFIEPQSAGAGIVADNIYGLLQLTLGGMSYVSSNVTVTNFTGALFLVAQNSSLQFDSNLTIAATGTNATSFFNGKGGLINTGSLNQFIHTDGGTSIVLNDFTTFNGGTDNVYEFANCARVADLSQNALFITSADGSGSYSVSGGTPISANFSITGQSAVYNRLNTGTGNPEIPMTWFTSEDLSTSRYVLATDWRYKSSQTINVPGVLTQGTTAFLTSDGLSGTAFPIYTAEKNEIFPRFRIRTRIANGPAAGPTSVTDTYTIYINGVASTMVLAVGDSTGGLCITNPQVLAPGDQVALSVTSDANTLAQDISITF